MEILSLKTLQQELNKLKSTARDLFATISPDHWQKELIVGKWSMAEHMGHLLLSGYPIASLFKQEDSFFQTFGLPPTLKRSYQEVKSLYDEKIKEGAQALPSSVVQAKDLMDVEESLEAWDALINKLSNRLTERWNDERLDSFLLPHPALGLITPRELLYFKHFHSLNHLEIIKRMKTL